MVVRMRHTRAHTGNRRSHHALKNKRVTVSKDGVAHPRHRALLDGSQYRGRSVMDVTAKRTLRTQKAQKRREREAGPTEKKTEEKIEEKK
jgi:ribosomal protein L32